MKEIKSVDIMSYAKFASAIAFVVGAIYGVFILIFAIIAMTAASSVRLESDAAFIAGPAGIVLALVVPFFYALAGFIGGLIGSAIYNLVAGKIGGIKVELADIDSK